jgi:hypothetical protein
MLYQKRQFDNGLGKIFIGLPLYCLSKRHFYRCSVIRIKAIMDHKGLSRFQEKEEVK